MIAVVMVIAVVWTGFISTNKSINNILESNKPIAIRTQPAIPTALPPKPEATVLMKFEPVLLSMKRGESKVITITLDWYSLQKMGNITDEELEKIKTVKIKLGVVGMTPSDQYYEMNRKMPPSDNLTFAKNICYSKWGLPKEITAKFNPENLTLKRNQTAYSNLTVSVNNTAYFEKCILRINLYNDNSTPDMYVGWDPGSRGTQVINLTVIDYADYPVITQEEKDTALKIASTSEIFRGYLKYPHEQFNFEWTYPYSHTIHISTIVNSSEIYGLFWIDIDMDTGNVQYAGFADWRKYWETNDNSRCKGVPSSLMVNGNPTICSLPTNGLSINSTTAMVAEKANLTNIYLHIIHEQEFQERVAGFDWSAGGWGPYTKIEGVGSNWGVSFPYNSAVLDQIIPQGLVFWFGVQAKNGTYSEFFGAYDLFEGNYTISQLLPFHLPYHP